MARQPAFTTLENESEHVYRVRQVLLDEAGENDWMIEGVVDLTMRKSADEPLLERVRIGR